METVCLQIPVGKNSLHVTLYYFAKIAGKQGVTVIVDYRTGFDSYNDRKSRQCFGVAKIHLLLDLPGFYALAGKESSNSETGTIIAISYSIFNVVSKEMGYKRKKAKQG